MREYAQKHCTHLFLWKTRPNRSAQARDKIPRTNAPLLLTVRFKVGEHTHTWIICTASIPLPPPLCSVVVTIFIHHPGFHTCRRYMQSKHPATTPLRPVAVARKNLTTGAFTPAARSRRQRQSSRTQTHSANGTNELSNLLPNPLRHTVRLVSWGCFWRCAWKP